MTFSKTNTYICDETISVNYLTMLLPLTVSSRNRIRSGCRHRFPHGSDHGRICVCHPVHCRVDRTGSGIFPLVRHHHRQVAFQRPFRADRLVVCAFAVACFHLYTGQAHGLGHVHCHGLALRRGFPFALYHRYGIRQTDKIMAATTVEQTCSKEAAVHGRSRRKANRSLAFSIHATFHNETGG